MQGSNSMKPATVDSEEQILVPFPHEIAFVDCDNSPAVRSFIEEQLAKVAHYYDRITFGRVNVRIPHKHGGVRMFHIHIQLDLPGKRIAVSREPEIDEKHSDPKAAIRDAFQKLTRELKDFAGTRKDHHKGS